MKKERRPRINLEFVLDRYMESGGDGPTEIDPVRHHIPYLVEALRECYAREDELIEALKIIRDDLDETLTLIQTGTHYTDQDKATRILHKIRNFANDASL